MIIAYFWGGPRDKEFAILEQPLPRVRVPLPMLSGVYPMRYFLR